MRANRAVGDDFERHRGIAGAAALILLCASAVPLAAPGEALVPGSIEGAPGWLLGPYGDGLGVGGGTYLAAMIAAFVAYLAVVLWSGSLGRRVVWGAIVVLVAAFALAPPLLSLDVFSYISYARLGADHGLDPYAAVPADLVADPAGDRVEDFRFAVSAYGPLFTLATYPIGVTSVAFALWALKAVAALAVLGVAGLTARLAAVRGASPRAAATFVALNPLVLVHVVGGAHNDALMALVLVAGAVALVAGLEASAGGGLAVAAAVKAAGVFAAPFALLGAERRARLLTGVAVALAAVAAVGLAVFGGDVANAVGIIGENQSTASHDSVPSTAARIAGIGVDPVRAVFGVA